MWHHKVSSHDISTFKITITIAIFTIFVITRPRNESRGQLSMVNKKLWVYISSQLIAYDALDLLTYCSTLKVNFHVYGNIITSSKLVGGLCLHFEIN